jgi:hypothetical protein
MKMNDLKKFGAVALAAVMAVTFAPVASLEVFAGNSGVETINNTKVITGTNATIEENGTYVVSAGATHVTISGAATDVVLNLNNTKGTTVEFGASSNKKAKVSLVAKTYSYQTLPNAVKAPDVSTVTITNVASASALAFDGNMIVTGTDEAPMKYLGSLPAVSTSGSIGAGEAVIIGNDAINTQVILNNDIYAENGTVNVSGLKDGKVARVDAQHANANAAIGTVTAESGKSLVGVKTTYTYRFKNDKTKQYGTSSYTEQQYAAGKNGLQTLAGNNLSNITTAAMVNINYVGLSGGRSVNTLSAIKVYDRAITLTEDKDDKFESSITLPYVDPQTYDVDDDEVPSGVSGITYFTKNPAGAVKDSYGIALLDGTKYVVNGSQTDDDKSELYTVSSYAANTIQIVRGSTDTTAVDALDYLKPQSFDVKITAPTSSSIIVEHAEWIRKNNKTAKKNYAVVYGSNRVQGVAAKKGLFDEAAENSSQVVSTAIKVPQVASGVYAYVGDAFTDTEVTLGDGITYFYDQETKQLKHDQANYVFGKLDVATKALKGVLCGETVDTTNYFDQATAGETVFVAKAIKGTFKGVNAKVNVLGEISQVKNADGSWTINEGYGSNAVPAYRMYRKSGEHVYTINPDEVKMLEAAGWINEGVAFKVNSVVSKTGTPVYRVYNKNNGGMHFYTASAAEKDMLLANGWTEGAVVFYGADKATGIPVYRTYNTGSNNGEHNYTTNIAESDMNVKAGWRAEGVAFYVFK